MKSIFPFLLLYLSQALSLSLWGQAPDTWLQAPLNYAVRLPQDHGQHPAQKVEWWYFTGNLRTSTGEEFGYQLTFFRIGMQFQQQNPSPWAVRDLHMTHFAISDLTGKKYRHQQRLDRAGPGLCGAAADKLAVWHEDWRAEQLPDGKISLTAPGKEISLHLSLTTASRPLLLHGDDGYSRKGSQTGNASIYYSLTRLPTTGTLRLGEREVSVTGESWMDHEFGTSFLEPGQRGWDWFSLHLSDGSDLMLFQLRQADPAKSNHAAGTLLRKDGSTLTLRAGDFALKPSQTGKWKSPNTSADYPLVWELEIPSQQLRLTTSTPLEGQEMLSAAGAAGPSYWEGAVRAEGKALGLPVEASGYLEMTGYGTTGMGGFFGAGP